MSIPFNNPMSQAGPVSWLSGFQGILCLLADIHLQVEYLPTQIDTTVTKFAFGANFG